MKKILFSFGFMLVALIMFSTQAFADEADYEWEDNGDGTATITEYLGDGGDVVIPDKLGGLTVTVLNDHGTRITSNGAFYNKNITSVVIPETVTTFGDFSFYRNQLTEVVIPKSVKSIGRDSFAENELTEITIPDSLTTIGSGSFKNNQLAEITIPDSVTYIGSGSFENNQLAEITIPDSVESIGNRAFSNNDLESIYILNPNTEFRNRSSMNAFANNPLTMVIYGHLGSSVESFANELGFNFQEIQVIDTRTQDVSITFLGGNLELDVSSIASFGNITLTEEAETYHTSFNDLFTIKDIRGTQEGYRLDVSATPFSNGEYELPRGSLSLSPLNSIERVGNGQGNAPSNMMENETIIDDGVVSVLQAEQGSGMGVFDFGFPTDALSLVVDPTTTMIEGNETTYTSTLTWDLVSAP